VITLLPLRLIVDSRVFFQMLVLNTFPLQVANMFFNEVVQRLVGSFENRCRTVYGPSVQVKHTKQGSHA
jgi:hypothetical protein